MEYKVYSNEEVASWSDAPRCLTKDVLKQHIDENGYFNRFKAIISLDYIDNAMNPILEQQLRTVEILRAYNDYGEWFVEFVIKKNLNEMSNNYDIWSDRYIKPFREVKMYDMDSLDTKWSILFTIAPHILMQHWDGRILVLNEEYQPRWIQEWHNSNKDYDFTMNRPCNPC